MRLSVKMAVFIYFSFSFRWQHACLFQFSFLYSCIIFSIFLYVHIFIILNLKIEKMDSPISNLTVHNFRSEVKRLTEPYKIKIEEAANHFKTKLSEYKTNALGKRSVQIDSPIRYHRVKTASLLSQISNQPQNTQLNKKDSIIVQPDEIKSYQLKQWNSSKQDGFKNLESINNYYSQIFFKKKIMMKNKKVCYDFKVDEKQMLIKIFQQIRSEQNYVSFQNVIKFFSTCKLFYLCYNVKPSKLEDLLKQSAHQFKDKLNLIQFLHIFFIDRPNILSYQNKDDNFVNKRCVLSEDNWKQLKTIFSTLDTFGNETIHMAPFIHKIKNNHSNRALINEAAIEYPQINRTIPIKKVIFNLQNRFNLEEKIQWKDIENIFHNFVYREEPTIDIIYKKMVERGDISRFSNYFMIKPQIIQQIKRIYYRCPKYCEYFVKTKFICTQIVQSSLIKHHLKVAIVRVIKIGLKTHYITLQDQLRLVSNEKHNYIDLDQLLEYFTIKGPINTTAEAQIQWNSDVSSDQENQVRVQSLWRTKSQEKSRFDNKKQGKSLYKPNKHRTICEQFNLRTKTGQTIMQRKTRQMREQKIKQQQRELNSKFKANPIPVDLNPQRYKSYLKKMEEEKQYKKEQFLKKKQKQNKIYQYLKTNTSLFTKKQKVIQQKTQDYTFVSKPLPWFVTEIYMLDKINESKLLRKKKIQIQTKFKIIKQWKNLPDALKQYTQPSQCSDKNLNTQKHSQQIKHKQVPNFKELQQRFAQQLQKKKQSFKPTKPQGFNLSSPKLDRKKQLIQTQLIKSNSTHNILKSNHLQHKNSLKSCYSQPRLAIPTTLKHQQLVNFTHQKLNNQLKQMQRALSEQRDRIRKQRNFANYMRSKLNRSLKKSSSLHQMVKSKKKTHQQLWKQLKRDNQEELCRMYSNVMSRPFLFQNKEVERVNRVSLPLEQPPNGFQPLKKKCRNQIGKVQHKISKHVHQSPLKQIEAQINDPSSHKKQSPQHFRYQFQQQSPNNLNQSF